MELTWLKFHWHPQTETCHTPSCWFLHELFLPAKLWGYGLNIDLLLFCALLLLQCIIRRPLRQVFYATVTTRALYELCLSIFLAVQAEVRFSWLQRPLTFCGTTNRHLGNVSTQPNVATHSSWMKLIASSEQICSPKVDLSKSEEWFDSLAPIPHGCCSLRLLHGFVPVSVDAATLYSMCVFHCHSSGVICVLPLCSAKATHRKTAKPLSENLPISPFDIDDLAENPTCFHIFNLKFDVVSWRLRTSLSLDCLNLHSAFSRFSPLTQALALLDLSQLEHFPMFTVCLVRFLNRSLTLFLPKFVLCSCGRISNNRSGLSLQNVLLLLVLPSWSQASSPAAQARTEPQIQIATCPNLLRFENCKSNPPLPKSQTFRLQSQT